MRRNEKLHNFKFIVTENGQIDKKVWIESINQICCAIELRTDRWKDGWIMGGEEQKRLN